MIKGRAFRAACLKDSLSAAASCCFSHGRVVALERVSGGIRGKGASPIAGWCKCISAQSPVVFHPAVRGSGTAAWSARWSPSLDQYYFLPFNSCRFLPHLLPPPQTLSLLLCRPRAPRSFGPYVFLSPAQPCLGCLLQ